MQASAAAEALRLRIVEEEAAKVAAGADGRNRALFKAAAALGELVAGGALGEELVAERLLQAGEAAGLARREAYQTIRSGLRTGRRNPRTLKDGGAALAGPVERRPPPPPAYPAQEEVAACWRACTGLYQDGPLLHRRNVAREWLRARGFALDRLAALDMVRVAEEGATLPAWFPGYPWVLACPLVDCTGLTRSIRWRAVKGARSPKVGGLEDLRALAADGGELAEAARAALRDPAVVECMSPLPLPLKSRAPGGYNARGLVLADPVARAVFAGRPEVDIPGVGLARWNGRLLLVEGEPALWAMATLGARWAADGSSFGVVGYTSGGWTAEHARRLPSGSTVRIIPDSDAAGQRMAEAVQRTMPPGVRVELAPIRR